MKRMLYILTDIMMPFLFALLFKSELNLFAIGGSIDNIIVCQNQVAGLKGTEDIMTTSTDDVEYQLWYHDTMPIARWTREEGFVEIPPSNGRLMYIGVNDVIIKKTRHNDSGKYELFWKLKSAKNSSSVTVNLEVIVPPTSLCIPNITREGSSLFATLPQKGCGIPHLTPNWRNGTQKSISDNVSVLNVELGLMPTSYTTCASGTSLPCFRGDVNKLCSHYTSKIEPGVEVCESEDADLFFLLDATLTSASVIGRKIWSKDNSIPIASWMESTNFVPSHLYGERLMAVGDNSIKIRNVTRSDTGTYILVLTSVSTHVIIEFVIHLEVLVPPTIQCIPNITREGDALKAVLPPEGCGFPHLVPCWKNCTQKVIHGNASVLSFESDIVPGLYTACACGKPVHCFHENVSKLCSNFMVSASQPQNESSSVSVVGIITLIIFYIVAGVVFYWMYRKRESIKRKLFSSTNSRGTAEETDVETALIDHTATAGTSTRGTAEETDAETALIDYTATESTESLDKDTKLQEKLLMQKKQKHEPGSNHTGKDDVKHCNKRWAAKYPQFQELASRLKTFEVWPKNHFMKPKELAVAGFFYKEKGDSVNCFFCGLELSDWEADDNAWAEHERCKPSCEHVRSHKKAGSSPGDSDEIKEIDDIQSRDEQEEQSILNKGEEKKKEKPQIIQGHLMCSICQKQKALITFLPCSHTTACFACGKKLTECNLCQKKIEFHILPYCKD